MQTNIKKKWLKKERMAIHIYDYHMYSNDKNCLHKLMLKHEWLDIIMSQYDYKLQISVIHEIINI